MTRYRLISEIGGGGMGVVYEGRMLFCMGQELPVAIKVIRANCCEDEDDLKLFAREAVTTLQINHDHPNLVTTFDFGQTKNGRPYLVMELVDGASVRSLAQGCNLSSAHIRRIARDTLCALEHLHAQGVIHRDVSPGNLLVSRKGRIKLADFGLVKPRDSSNSGRFRGTAAYSSPEALQGLELGEDSDLYSLAVVLYELITGKQPYGSGGPVAVFHRMAGSDLEPLPEGTPADLEELVMGMMALEVENRAFSSAREAIEFIDGQGNAVASDAELIELVDAWTTARPRKARLGKRAITVSLDEDTAGQRKWVAFIGILVPIAFMVGLAVAGLIFDFTRPADTAEQSVEHDLGQARTDDLGQAPGQALTDDLGQAPETAPIEERSATAGPAQVTSAKPRRRRTTSKRDPEPTPEAPGDKSRPADKLFYEVPRVERTEWHIYVSDDEKEMDKQ